MKKTWVRNIFAAVIALTMVIGLASSALAIDSDKMPGFKQDSYTINDYANKALDLSTCVTDATKVSTDGDTPAYTLAYSIPDTATQGVCSIAGSTLTALKNGTTTARVTKTSTTDPDDKASADVTINVSVPVTVSLSPTAVTITKGNTYTPTLTVTPDATEVNWSSSSSGIASVNASGVITGVAPGTTTITATSKWDSSKTASISITVELPTITVAKPNPATITSAGSTATVSATLDSKGSTTVTNSSAVSWESSNTAVATVLGSSTNFSGGTASATITAVATGTATITCRSGADGAVLGTTKVTVGNPTPVITLRADDTSLGYGESTKLYIDVENAIPGSDGYAYVLLTRSSRRVYVEGVYSHPKTMTYYVQLRDGHGEVTVYPQYSGNVTITAEATSAAKKSISFSVSGYPTLPQTGQDFTIIYVLGACCLAAAAAWVIVYAKKKKHNAA